MQWIRSALFVGQMYLAMPIIGLIYLPWALVSPVGAHAACHAYCRWVIWTLGWMTGLRCEVRGTPPTGEVMVAAKHQSFLDILLIYNAMPRGKIQISSGFKSILPNSVKIASRPCWGTTRSSASAL